MSIAAWKITSFQLSLIKDVKVSGQKMPRHAVCFFAFTKRGLNRGKKKHCLELEGFIHP